ncbi:hypothetical protein PG995_013221 [Apiospora arundinis]
MVFLDVFKFAWTKPKPPQQSKRKYWTASLSPSPVSDDFVLVGDESDFGDEESLFSKRRKTRHSGSSSSDFGSSSSSFGLSSDGFGSDTDDFGAVDEDIDKIQENLRQHFSSPRGVLTFQRFISKGGNGFAALLQDNRISPRNLSFSNALYTTMTCFKFSMRSKLYDLSNLDTPRGGTYRTTHGRLRPQLRRSQPAWAVYRHGVLGEWVIWSLLAAVYHGAGAGAQPRALVHHAMPANVAMTWPPRGKELEPEKLETVSQRTAPTPYAHNDLHLENIMFGNMDPDVAEHSMFPRLKLIDFGTATDKPISAGLPDKQNESPYQGDHINVRRSAEAVMRLIAGNNEKWLPTFEQQPSYVSGFETDATILCSASNDESYPGLDPSLRQLIGQMMARYYQDRPRLEEILETASQAVLTKSEADYPGYEQEESDTAIAEFVRNFFFDAPGGSSDASDGNPDEW